MTAKIIRNPGEIRRLDTEEHRQSNIEEHRLDSEMHVMRQQIAESMRLLGDLNLFERQFLKNWSVVRCSVHLGSNQCLVQCHDLQMIFKRFWNLKWNYFAYATLPNFVELLFRSIFSTFENQFRWWKELPFVALFLPFQLVYLRLVILFHCHFGHYVLRLIWEYGFVFVPISTIVSMQRKVQLD